MHRSIKSVDICIATYKRKQLLIGLLNSIANLKFPAPIDVTVIVIDNDLEGSGKMAVDDFRNKCGFPTVYEIEPVKNISLARNRAISCGESDVIMFIDDDEIVHKSWLDLHLIALDRYEADVVRGPAYPIFPENTSPWVIESGFFSPRLFAEGEALPTAATNNVSFLRSAAQDADDKFSTAYGLTGGGDNEFFHRLHKKGKKIVWSSKPITYERVHEFRTNMKWMLFRTFREGQVYTRINFPVVLTRESMSYLFRTLFLLLAATALAIISLPISRLVAFSYLVKVAKRLGRLTGYTGLHYKEYRASS